MLGNIWVKLCSWRSGKYKQTREFNEQNRPVRDIDFTHHGRSSKHPNPHKHEWSDNPGNSITKKRDEITRPLSEPTVPKPTNKI